MPRLSPDAPEIERLARDAIAASALFGTANVIMQLARLPVGRGVAESTVDSGRVDRHPFKRQRTTGSYLIVAMLGTEHERSAMRREVDRQHRAVVRTEEESDVAYSAFDSELQLWVAACIYVGFSVWLAGGGVKGGLACGQTDEWGYKVVSGKAEVHDLHATMLHLLGVDHKRLTVRFGGRDMRLTDVHGEVLADVLA